MSLDPDVLMSVQVGRASSPLEPPKGVKRTKDGCITCRYYRKGCGKEKPICKRCLDLGHECIWPPPSIPVQKPKKRPRSDLQSPVSIANARQPSSEGTPPLAVVGDPTEPRAAFRSSPSAVVPSIPPIEVTPVLADFNLNGIASAINPLLPIVDGTAFESNVEMSFPLAHSISDLLDLGGVPAGTASRSDGDGHLQDPMPEFDALMNEFLDMWGGSSGSGGANKDPRRPVDTFDQAIWAQVHPSEAPAGNPISLKMYIQALMPWIGGSAKVLSAFEKHVRRVWDAQDECSLALRSSAELAGTAFNRSHPELGSEDLGAAFTDTGQNEIRRRAGAIVDEVVAKPDLPFWVKLTALLELATYEFFTNGALSYGKLVSRAEDVAFTVYPRGSEINLASVKGVENYGLANVVWADVCRSIACSVPTSFTYINVRPATSSATDHEDVRGLEYMTGCPDDITVLLSQISHLSSILDFCMHPYGQPLPLIHRQKADEILERIANFTIDLGDLGKGDGPQNAARATVQEIWRQTAYIHIYISVFHKSPLFKPLKDALAQNLKLYSMVELGLPILLRGALPLPIFLTATVAISDEDRKVCHDRLLKVAGVSGALKEGARVVEQCWRETEETGEFVTWRDMVKRGTGQVAFL